MDNKKRAQAAWAALLALLALLFIPQVNLGRNGNPSESPAEDPAPDESGEENSNTNEDGAEDGTEDGAEDSSSDATDEGWFQDDPEGVGDPNAPTGTPDSGGDAPAPEGGWGVDDGGEEAPETGGYGGLIEDILDQYPTASNIEDLIAQIPDAETVEEVLERADLEDSDGGETTYGNDAASGYPGHADTGNNNPSGYDIPGYNREAALENDPDLTWAGEVAEGAIESAGEWAADNPEEALLITGAAALTGGYAYVYYGASGSAMALSASQATQLSAVGVPMTAAANLPSGFRSKLQEAASSGSDSGTSAPEDEPWAPAPGDDAGDADDVADVDEDTPTATPGTGGHVDVQEPDPDPVSAPEDEPWAPAPGDESGDEDDIADPESGDGGHLSGGFV